MISCPSCGKKKQMDVSKFFGHKLSINCKCGQTFKCRVEGDQTAPEEMHSTPFPEPRDRDSEGEKASDAGKDLEANDVKEQVFYVGKNGKVKVGCMKCGFVKSVDPQADPRLTGPFRFRCKCGHISLCRIEQRKHYRKNVELKGSYFDQKTNNKAAMVVKNISFSGIGFTTIKNDDFINEGDILTVTFTLDDGRGTVIKRDVCVRSVRNRKIGCEFLEKPLFDRELGFYLQP